MQETEIYDPRKLSGNELDLFLARGWYRMFQSVFTTHYVSESDNFYRVFWLRYNLEKIDSTRHRKLLQRNNRRFSVRFSKAAVTDELEALYRAYKTGIPFDPSPSVYNWLYGEQGHDSNIFDTDIIEIRDRGKLVAAGVFDNGDQSIAGIMNFYHPDYRKYSPGKYLMLLKIAYAKANGKQWYYPGYIIHGYPKFDYKLFADEQAAELYIPELETWYQYHPALPAAVVEAARTGKPDINIL